MTTDYSNETVFTVPPHVLARSAGGEMIILNLENEQYYSLEDVGARAFTLVQEGLPWGSVLDALLDEWNVERPTLDDDLRTLFDDLIDEGIVIPG